MWEATDVVGEQAANFSKAPFPLLCVVESQEMLANGLAYGSRQYAYPPNTCQAGALSCVLLGVNFKVLVSRKLGIRGIAMAPAQNPHREAGEVCWVVLKQCFAGQ